MRITGGNLRGRKIALRSHPSVRPTSARVREAVFSVLGQNLEGVRFLDAFGGSGIMGLEAFSRGATVTICESDLQTFAFIRKNVKMLGAEIEMLRGAVPGVLKRRIWEDAFLDPPYSTAPENWLQMVTPFVANRITIEFHKRWIIPNTPNEWSLVRHARYGDSTLATYQLDSA